MSSFGRLVAATGLGAALCVAATSAFAADAKAGRALAEKWCVSCHVVGPTGQSAASDAAPTFVEIANRPNTSEEGLRAFLAEPHRSAMKGIVLPRLEIADLAAYIASLREP